MSEEKEKDEMEEKTSALKGETEILAWKRTHAGVAESSSTNTLVILVYSYFVQPLCYVDQRDEPKGEMTEDDDDIFDLSDLFRALDEENKADSSSNVEGQLDDEPNGGMNCEDILAHMESTSFVSDFCRALEDKQYKEQQKRALQHKTEILAGTSADSDVSESSSNITEPLEFMEEFQPKVPRPSDFIESLAPSHRDTVESLRGIQRQLDHLEADFSEEKAALEGQIDDEPKGGISKEARSFVSDLFRALEDKQYKEQQKRALQRKTEILAGTSADADVSESSSDITEPLEFMEEFQPKVPRPSDFLESLAPSHRDTVESLRGIQRQLDRLEADFSEEKAALEARYRKLYQPFYTKRFEIVNGMTEVEGVVSETKADAGEGKSTNYKDKAFSFGKFPVSCVENGVPGFWLTAMKNNPVLAERIVVRDEEALMFLRDIRWSGVESSKGFKLEFFFDSNPYFTNSVLTKTFVINEDDMYLEEVIGTEIQWHPKKCLTQKASVKRQSKKDPVEVKLAKTTVDCVSFFNFFKPRQAPEDDDELYLLMPRYHTQMAEDYDMGLTIRDRFIPHAVSWFSWDDEDEYEDEDEERRSRERKSQKMFFSYETLIVGGQEKKHAVKIEKSGRASLMLVCKLEGQLDDEPNGGMNNEDIPAHVEEFQGQLDDEPNGGMNNEDILAHALQENSSDGSVDGQIQYDGFDSDGFWGRWAYDDTSSTSRSPSFRFYPPSYCSSWSSDSHVVDFDEKKQYTVLHLKIEIVSPTRQHSAFPLSSIVHQRVDFLKNIQGQHDDLKVKFFEERAALEAKYEKLYQPLYEQRRAIVNGAGLEDCRVPKFWLKAMENNELLAKMIQESLYDEKALKYLEDIKWSKSSKGFKLEFFFGVNPFFSNDVLTKTYCFIDEDEQMLEKAIGTEIYWKKGKCLTHKVKELSNAPISNAKKLISFFHFFYPPQVSQVSEGADEYMVDKVRTRLGRDYTIGLTLRDKIIPHAVSWFTGEAVHGEEYGDLEDDDEDIKDDNDVGKKGDDDDGEEKSETKENVLYVN